LRNGALDLGVGFLSHRSGLGGGALQPTGRRFPFETFPPQRRGAAMAIFGDGRDGRAGDRTTLGGLDRRQRELGR